jgi:hypothetical protein
MMLSIMSEFRMTFSTEHTEAFDTQQNNYKTLNGRQQNGILQNSSSRMTQSRMPPNKMKTIRMTPKD